MMIRCLFLAGGPSEQLPKESSVVPADFDRFGPGCLRLQPRLAPVDQPTYPVRRDIGSQGRGPTATVAADDQQRIAGVGDKPNRTVGQAGAKASASSSTSASARGLSRFRPPIHGGRDSQGKFRRMGWSAADRANAG